MCCQGSPHITTITPWIWQISSLIIGKPPKNFRKLLTSCRNFWNFPKYIVEIRDRSKFSEKGIVIQKEPERG